MADVLHGAGGEFRTLVRDALAEQLVPRAPVLFTAQHIRRYAAMHRELFGGPAEERED